MQTLEMGWEIFFRLVWGSGRQMCRHRSATILIPDICVCVFVCVSMRVCVCVFSLRVCVRIPAQTSPTAGTNQPQASASQFASMQRESFLSSDSFNPSSTRRRLTLSVRHRQTLGIHWNILEGTQPCRRSNLDGATSLSVALRFRDFISEGGDAAERYWRHQIYGQDIWNYERKEKHV